MFNIFSHNFFWRRGRVHLRIISNRKKKDKSLGIECTEDEFVIATTTKATRGRNRLAERLHYYSSILSQIRYSLAEEDREHDDVARIMLEFECRVKQLPVPVRDAFSEWFRKFINTKTNSGTKNVYKHTYNKLKQFDKWFKERTFEEINFDYLTRFEAYCAHTATKNARNIHLRNIRAVFNYAIDNEVTTIYPFRRFKIKPEPTRKRAMSLADLRELFDYPVEPYAEIYRDMYKLIFLLIGINTVDLHRLTDVTRDGRIEYARAKTGRLYSIKVEPEAMELIERYKGENGLLCIADRWSDSKNFRKQLNRALQRIGDVERVGRGGKKIISSRFGGISSSWARHSWATIAAQLDIPKETIAAALGHAANSVTDIYIDFDTRKIDEANRRVIDYVLYDKK